MKTIYRGATNRYIVKKNCKHISQITMHYKWGSNTGSLLNSLLILSISTRLNKNKASLEKNA